MTFSKLNEWRHAFHNHQFPRLKQVNPLLNLGVGTFGWFNLILGATLFQRATTAANFFLLTQPFGYPFWGTYFIVGGISLLIGQFMNWWSLTRITLLAMLFSKIVWFAALTYRQIIHPNSNIFLLLFFGLAIVLQAGMYIYFPVYKRVQTWKR
jgi:hypothetical protein